MVTLKKIFSTKKAPTRPFTHADDCKIVGADPTAEIEWNYDGDGLWKAECVCTTEYIREPLSDDRVRLDPYDPSTFRHAGQCEHRDTSDSAFLKALLTVRDGAGGGYWWVQCSACDTAWQVPHYADPAGGR